MPEGHTLHRLARLHQRRYAGKPVGVSSPQGRFTADASRVDGRVLVKAEAHGKHLLHRYAPDLTVHIHLGLIGTFRTDLHGPNKCEILTDAEIKALHARLGADPLRRDADPDRAYARISRSRTPIAVLLMDQQVIAGIGNVYRAELLYRHAIHPMREGKGIDATLWKEMWTDLVTLMRYGVRTGRIDTVRPEHDPARTGSPPRQDRHGGEVYVYRRAGQPCLVCGTPVAMTELAGRNLYWCPVCQPT